MKKRDDNSVKPFRTTLVEFKNTLKALFELTNNLAAVLTVLLLYLLNVVITAIDAGLVYTVTVALLFMLLAIALYGKSNNAAEALLSFSVGIFTAFTIEWDAPRFSIFLISFAVLSASIIIIKSIQLAANVQDNIINAAQFYGGKKGYRENKERLGEVKNQVQKSLGRNLLDIESISRAILFLAYRKVEVKHMEFIIHDLAKIHISTNVEEEEILNLLYGTYVLSEYKETKYKENIEVISKYLIEGTASPRQIIATVNNSIGVIYTRNIDLDTACIKIMTLLNLGYTQKQITKNLDTYS